MDLARMEGSAGGFVNSLAHGGSSGVHTARARRGQTLRVGKELMGKLVLRSEWWSEAGRDDRTGSTTEGK